MHRFMHMPINMHRFMHMPINMHRFMHMPIGIRMHIKSNNNIRTKKIKLFSSESGFTRIQISLFAVLAKIKLFSSESGFSRTRTSLFAVLAKIKLFSSESGFSRTQTSLFAVLAYYAHTFRVTQNANFLFMHTRKYACMYTCA